MFTEIVICHPAFFLDETSITHPAANYPYYFSLTPNTEIISRAGAAAAMHKKELFKPCPVYKNPAGNFVSFLTFPIPSAILFAE